MSEIICASSDCKYLGINNRCLLSNVTLSEHFIHTVHEGLQHFWRCKQYEQSAESKRLEEQFINVLKKQGMEVI